MQIDKHQKMVYTYYRQGHRNTYNIQNNKAHPVSLTLTQNKISVVVLDIVLVLDFLYKIFLNEFIILKKRHPLLYFFLSLSRSPILKANKDH